MTRVSVIVPCYDDETFIRAAIDSLLAQTFPDFELIVVDDASTDGSRAILDSYRDPRLRIITNETNLGGPASRNRALAQVTTEYVAELDADDLAFPTRLEKQLSYLDAHPEVAVAGCQAALIDVHGKTIGRFTRPVTELGIRWSLQFQSPLIHSAVTFRRAIICDELGGYEERFRYGEDFDLWTRVAARHRIANLPDTLVAYRFDPRSLSSAGNPAREGYRERKAARLAVTLGEPEDVVKEWLALGDLTIAQTPDQIRAAADMLDRCASRFAAAHGENGEVRALQAEMLTRGLEKSARIWPKIWRRDRATALRFLPKAAILFLFGSAPLRIRRALRQRQ